MKKDIGRLLFLSLLFLASSAAQAGEVSPQPPQQNFVPGEIIVQFKAEALTRTLRPGVRTTGLPSVDALNRQFRARGLFPLFANPPQDDSEGLGQIYIIRLPPRADVLAAAAQYASDPNVEYAEPNYFAHITLMPDDTFFALGEQWNLHNTGQLDSGGNPGTPDADIDAPDAWDTTTGSPSVVIAIIDTGVDFQHPDLDGKIWTNLGEADNGSDDDGNGYVDDVNGWNFVADSMEINGNFVNGENPDDDHSHGSHVSGIAAAETNNTEGIAGVCPNCTIMPLKVCNAAGNCAWSDIAAAIRYAADNGAKIISMSLGGNCNKTVAKAVNYAWNKGVLIIAAAGNGAVVDPYHRIDWPARFRRVMAVGATNNLDKRASFSDYGSQLDLMAPGVSVWSALRVEAGSYGSLSGTSMATPHVSGVAGLVWSRNPVLTNGQVWRILITSTDNLRRSGWDKWTGWGRLNANNAVNLALTSPTPISQTKATC